MTTLMRQIGVVGAQDTIRGLRAALEQARAAAAEARATAADAQQVPPSRSHGAMAADARRGTDGGAELRRLREEVAALRSQAWTHP